MTAFRGRDGAELTYREVGSGPLTVLVHGFTSSATENWIEPGHAARIGGRVVMAELRGHGISASPQDAAAYPKDVLVDDLLALLEHVGARDYVLAGYSAGARTVARALVRGALPARAVIAAMGLEAIVHGAAKGALFRRAFEDPASYPSITGHIRRAKLDTIALTHVLDSYVDTPRAALVALDLPITVACGDRDQALADAQALAAGLPRAHFVTLGGDHTSASSHASLGDAIATEP
jgi:pimeloyl-ACP methyl ester carboxylesterase